jgi:predicted SnoaL-like aldol condensation-catalyzing enzyme
MKAAPDRRMHVYRTIASGDLVAIEADAFFGGRTLKSCVFLTFDRDGWITSDHSYGADPTATTVR